MDIAFFRYQALTKGFTSDEIARFAAMLSEQKLAAGERLCVEGAQPRGLFLVRDGRLKVAKRAANGQEQALATLDAPTAIGELEIVTGDPSSASVIADCDVVAYLLPVAAFDQLVERGDAIATKMVRNIARVAIRRLAETNTRMVALMSP